MRKTSELIWQDAQHQVLFEILDAIAEPGAGEAVLRRLRDYTETHFTLEERYMELLDYPGIEVHRRAHDRFRELGAEGIRTLGKPAAVLFDVKSVLPKGAADARL